VPECPGPCRARGRLRRGRSRWPVGCARFLRRVISLSATHHASETWTSARAEMRCAWARVVGGVAGGGCLTCCSQCMRRRVTRLRGRTLSSLSCMSFLSHQHHVSCLNSKALAFLCMRADFVRSANSVIKHKALCMRVSGPCFVYALVYFLNRGDIFLGANATLFLRGHVVGFCMHARTHTGTGVYFCTHAYGVICRNSIQKYRIPFHFAQYSENCV